MIRLNYSSSGDDTNALWVNRQISASVILFSLTSSYDQSLWEISGSVISNKTQGGDGWILVQSSKAAAPTASGQWWADISPYLSATAEAKWDQVNQIAWVDDAENYPLPIALANYIWNDWQSILDSKYDGGSIDTERVWVSGSNDPIITDYVSSNENATFNTYQE